MTEPSSPQCSRCGTSLSVGTTDGLCPKCLLAMNLDSRTMPEEEKPPVVPAPTPEELVSLQNNVQFQLARAFRNRALCYPPRSADRVAALNQAIQQLGKPLQQLAQDDLLAWEIRIDQVTCLRLLENLAPATVPALPS